MIKLQLKISKNFGQLNIFVHFLITLVYMHVNSYSYAVIEALRLHKSKIPVEKVESSVMLTNRIFLPLLETMNHGISNNVTCLLANLHDRRLSVPNITAQLNQCHGKRWQHPLWREDPVKLAYLAELLSRSDCWGSKTMSKGSSRPRHAMSGQ